jgi:hypothetical protein
VSAVPTGQQASNSVSLSSQLIGYETNDLDTLTRVGLFFVSLFNWKGAKYRLKQEKDNWK